MPSTSPCTVSLRIYCRARRADAVPLKQFAPAQFSFSLYKEDGRRAGGSEVVSLAFDSEVEAARWAGALQEALHALRAQARAPARVLPEVVSSCLQQRGHSSAGLRMGGGGRALGGRAAGGAACAARAGTRCTPPCLFLGADGNLLLCSSGGA